MPDRKLSPTEPTQRSKHIKAVIFDIGRVIVPINLNRLIEPLAALAGNGPGSTEKLSPRQAWAAIEADPRWSDWQEGRMTAEEWHERVAGRLRVTIGFAEFCAIWNCALDPEPILGERLFEELGKHQRLALLSNTDPLHSSYIEKHFAFVKHFPVRIYSCGVGASKPSPAIYSAALTALGALPAETLYIDDLPEFAAAARSMGLDAICFESPAQLANQLSSRGLLDKRSLHDLINQ